MSGYHVGIDLGGTKIEIAAFDQKGTQIFQLRVPTPQSDYRKTLNDICNLVAECQNKLGPANCVGIATPGAQSLLTGLMKNCNSTCLNNRPFKNDLQARLNLPVKMANDADCFTLSEAIDGAGSRVKGVVNQRLNESLCESQPLSQPQPIKEPLIVYGVIIGTGVGGGIVYDKKLIQGVNKISGEWGHNPMPHFSISEADSDANNIFNRQRSCYCGKKNCIETYLSGPSLAADFHYLTGIELKAEEVVHRALQRDPDAEKVLDFYYDNLAKALASVINILDPHVIVLGGGLSNIKSLYSIVPSKWDKYVFSDEVRTQLVPPEYGDSSGVRGAAWLCLNI